MASEVVVSFGWGVVISGAMTFITAFLGLLLTYKKNELDAELARNKDAREAAESIAGRRRIADAIRQEMLGPHRAAVAAERRTANDLQRSLDQARESAENFRLRAEGAERRAVLAETERDALQTALDEALERERVAERGAAGLGVRAGHAERQLREMRGIVRRLRQEGSGESQRTI
ncbi:unnamed protein product [Clonostachys solani]|uniref:Uncharacterized protein n=1 Tax=Clonostachys solani TaxID=160281 RepID=A0A9N9ZGD0_9HYPO|nr:unnamed protein product [Clonostachys solani]